ncbi:unnamed protein product [Rotaria sp. Silwood2]|nr:unnamed protein product [Rotaria sp. Silwood2]CAF4536749.1 unnamed protein product [Rotaria sp. Silwood2]
MYQHLRIAMEQAQQRLQYKQEQENIRRRRCQNTLEEKLSTVVDEPVTTYDNQMEKESNIHVEVMHQMSTDPDETSDINDDFNLLPFHEDTLEFQSGINSHCEILNDNQDEPLLLNDLFSPNTNQNIYFLHSHITMKTHDFCKKLVEIFRDANISNIHRSRILRLINSILPQPHNSPATLKDLYDSMQGKGAFQNVCRSPGSSTAMSRHN